MARTSNISARVEPEIKEQAEKILARLDIPMPNAIGLFSVRSCCNAGTDADDK